VFSKRKRFKPLIVEVYTRGDVIAEYATVADSDLDPGMFEGSMRKTNEADVVILKNKRSLAVLKSRLPIEEIIDRIRG
jgi:hypothetical protein